MRGAIALLFAAGAACWARAGEQVLKFADPAAPGKIVIQMGLGDVRVVGAPISEVKVVSAEDLSGESEPRDDGLRRLDAGGDHTISSEGNVVTIVCNGMFGGHRSPEETNLLVTVPVATSVVIERAGPGETTLEKLSGDVEVHAAIGDIVLEGMSGGAVVETVNGDVRAVFTGLAADHAISISAVRGDVDLHVPVTAKADVRFRTFRGEVLTDFGDELKTRMETGWSEDEETASVEEEKARAEQEREHAREMERQAREEAKRAAAEAKRAAGKNNSGVSIPPIPPIPPMPAIPHIPPMAGGRVVAGTLNGGGTDITITTLSGEIRFRKAK
jgi:hypothetical protein